MREEAYISFADFFLKYQIQNTPAKNCCYNLLDRLVMSNNFIEINSNHIVIFKIDITHADSGIVHAV
jgi:hypothetical protein